MTNFLLQDNLLNIIRSQLSFTLAYHFRSKFSKSYFTLFKMNFQRRSHIFFDFEVFPRTSCCCKKSELCDPYFEMVFVQEVEKEDKRKRKIGHFCNSMLKDREVSFEFGGRLEVVLVQCKFDVFYDYNATHGTGSGFNLSSRN